MEVPESSSPSGVERKILFTDADNISYHRVALCDGVEYLPPFYGR